MQKELTDNSKRLSHLVCGRCGILLNCEQISVSLIENDQCGKREYQTHWPKQVKCDCMLVH